jgi:hypothetical protein
MRMMRHIAVACLSAILVFAFVFLSRQEAQASRPDELLTNSPGLTIYNAQFAVVRQKLPLELKAGTNRVEVNDITAHLEPDSVILRSPDSGRRLQILEQNYRNDPITAEMLLSIFEGKRIGFQTTDQEGKPHIIEGKIIRSGYVPHYQAFSLFGQQYYQQQMAYVHSGAEQPVIEVEGKLQFTLPGQPIFPALADDTVLKPTLYWQLQADKPGALDTEFSYVTGGMTWAASYNVIAPPKGNVLDLVGWVTLDNQSGRTFHDARIKLMAGDVNKIQPTNVYGVSGGIAGASYRSADAMMMMPPVTERSFDEYHLYSLQRSTTLRDRETKQVEFVRAVGVQSQTVYVYDGFVCDTNYRNWPMESIRQQENFGLTSNPKVWVMQEFKNTKENNLGMALPKGRVRFYRRDDDGQLEFTGENEIDHTPKDEKIRLYTGNAFDLTGERRRLRFQADYSAKWVDETFEIKVRNHKSAPAELRVVEHLYRWVNWEISKNTDPFKKTDAQSVEFTVQIPPDGEKTITYQVHYSW